MNIGLITDISFWQMGNGQNARIRELHAFLSHYAHLTLYYLGDDPLPFPGLMCQEGDKRTQLASLLEKAQHDLIIVEKLHLAWITDLELKNTRIYLDAHDIAFERAQQFQQFGRTSYSLSFEEEIACFRKFDKVIFLHDEDVEKMVPFLGKDRLLLCPHPVTPEADIAIREEVKTISFFGGPSWPNIDGLQWFHDDVLPLLGDLAQKCIVHGSMNYSPFFTFLPRLNRGQLFTSLNSHYKNVDIAINPVRYGTGLKIKSVEALAYGIPLVTTSIGAQGLHTQSNRAFLLADTPQDFADAMRQLDVSLALRESLSLRSREYARQRFTPHACFHSLMDIDV
jgi:glycosyltransferase involved in cell wall biosynthesis